MQATALAYQLIVCHAIACLKSMWIRGLSDLSVGLTLVLVLSSFNRKRIDRSKSDDLDFFSFRYYIVRCTDTPPLRAVIDRWTRSATVEERAAYLATRLEPKPARRGRLAASLASDPRRLALGMFAELFVGPAANVLVFFADLYGETATYNTPGSVSDDNWSMRVPGDFRAVYEERRARGEAMDVAGALALALRARGDDFVKAHAALIAALEARAAVRL